MKPVAYNERSDWRITIWRLARLTSSVTGFALRGNSVISRDAKSVCFITETLGFGGTEAHTIEVIRSLLDRGHQVTLLCCNHNVYEDRLAAEIREAKLTLWHTDLKVNIERWDDIRRWNELLQKVTSDVLILPKGGNNVGNLNFVLCCRKFFGKIYWIEHLEAEARQPLRLASLPKLKDVHGWLVKRLRSLNADRIIAVSELVGRRLTRDRAYPPDKVVVIPNGVTWQNYKRDEKRGTAFRHRHAIPHGAFVFGMMTRLSEEKGIDVALTAFDHLVRAHPSRAIRLAIAGTGPIEERLKEQTRSLGLQEVVFFLGFERDSAAVLSGYDAILLPSRAEGLPLALLEGMAAGCIPIVSRIGGMPEAVNSRDIGWVVPPDDSGALSAAMHDLLTQSDLDMRRARQRVAQRVRDTFDIKRCHQRILETCGL